MNSRRQRATLGLAIGAALLTAAAAPADDPLPPADAAITAAAIEHHVRFLASDELEGRSTGTPHTVRAARYLAANLKRAGLEPAGDDGTFLQEVPLLRTQYDAPPELVLYGARGGTVSLEYGAEFTVNVAGDPRSTGRLTLQHVTAEPEERDEATGTVALALHGNSRDVREWLEALGTPKGEGWGLLVRFGRTQKGRARPTPRPRLEVAETASADGVEEVRLSGPIVDRVKAGEFVAISLEFHGSREEIADYNVIGKITGVGTQSSREIARETIVFSAHYDHIGTTPNHGVEGHEDEDTINNGADDDASGVAAVLELAEAFGAGPKPARTLVFLLATGEERGLLGTNHYIAHPSIPLEDTVTNLNFEMLGRPDDLVGGHGKLWLTGFERSSLGPAFRERGIDVVADERPEQNFFMRSDNIAFVRKGIVGQTLSTYNMHRDYHTVNDEADAIDYPHMEACVRAGFEASRMLADGSLTPAWNEGEPKLGRGR